MAFSFEDLKVYRDSITFVKEIHVLLNELGKRCPPAIRSQLSRAALSIPLNIAEGNGRWHKAEKRQYFYISRGSAYECVAILQVMARLGLLTDDLMSDFHNALTIVSKKLSALIRSVDELNWNDSTKIEKALKPSHFN
ncbi:MAG: four helix bundle protein [Proteobacteria bacterium]|nr:MAG: four helix bundle protein [Pseudomonadota bacterium]